MVVVVVVVVTISTATILLYELARRRGTPSRQLAGGRLARLHAFVL